VRRNDEVSLLDKTGVGQPAAEGYDEWMGRFANPGDARWSPLLSPRDSAAPIAPDAASRPHMMVRRFVRFMA
jgi:hypothetical protein